MIEVTAKNGNVDDPAIAGVVDKVRQVVATQPLAKVTRTFKDPNTADLKSMDGRNGLILVYVGGTADQASDAAGELIKALPDDPNATVRAGGTLGVQQEIRMKVREGLVTSESISLPVSLVVLVFVFGGLVAAILPIAVGVTSIVTTLPVLLLATNFTQVSVHALTVASAFGLGLSIDFGLLMVSRYRE